MKSEIIEYVKQARKLKASNEDIKSMLLASGWPEEQVDAALTTNLDMPLPPPPPPPTEAAPTPPASPGHPVSPAPVAVVQSMSTRGFEYIIMFISLYISASAIGNLLHNFVNSVFADTSSSNNYYSSYSNGDTLVSYASSALIVALPVFCWLFLRLKKAELADPTLKRDPSRRKAVHLTLVITFLIGIFKLIGYFFSLLNGDGERSYSIFSIFGFLEGSGIAANSAVANLVHTLITFAIAGGIFLYYWNDQHHKA